MAVHVRYNLLYISLSSSTKLREKTKFCVVWRTWTTSANFIVSYSEFNTAFHTQFRGNIDSEKQTKRLKGIPRFPFLAHFWVRMQAMNEYREGPNVDGSLWAKVSCYMCFNQVHEADHRGSHIGKKYLQRLRRFRIGKYANHRIIIVVFLSSFSTYDPHH